MVCIPCHLQCMIQANLPHQYTNRQRAGPKSILHNGEQSRLGDLRLVLNPLQLMKHPRDHHPLLFKQTIPEEVPSATTPIDCKVGGGVFRVVVIYNGIRMGVMERTSSGKRLAFVQNYQE